MTASTATAIAIRDDQVQFDEYQRRALMHMGVENATDADLAIFMHHCKRTGLDPFARQIHMIGRNTKNQRTQQWETKFTIQTGIDGYRLIARRAAGREGYGYEDTLWCGADGVWSSIWLDDTPPVAAKVVVVRNGQRFPAVARYKAYVQTKRDGNPNSIWAQRDAEQLEKCAEALALRKAFPQDLSGIYTEDEMHAQRVDEAPERPTSPVITAADFAPKSDPAVVEHLAEIVEEERADTRPEPDGITDAQSKMLHASFNELGITERDQRLGYCTNLLRREVESSKELSKAEASQVIDALQQDIADKDSDPWAGDRP